MNNNFYEFCKKILPIGIGRKKSKRFKDCTAPALQESIQKTAKEKIQRRKEQHIRQKSDVKAIERKGKSAERKTIQRARQKLEEYARILLDRRDLTYPV